MSDNDESGALFHDIHAAVNLVAEPMLHEERAHTAYERGRADAAESIAVQLGRQLIEERAPKRHLRAVSE